MDRDNKKKIIGILGGTFNPIHKGHIELAVEAHRQFHLDEILVMPSGDPSSYKDDSEVLASKHRCNMVAAAIKEYPYMKLSTLEVNREGRTYTADTLREIIDNYDEIYFIIGADSLFSIQKWYQADYVMKHCHLLAANRDNESREDLKNQIHYLETEYGAKIDYLKIKELPISSTEIRENIANHKTVHSMVPEPVMEYIKQHNLYQK